MWIDSKFMTEPEIQAYINALMNERDQYKKELIEVLRKECECIMGNDTDCSICPYYTMVTNTGCPSMANTYSAKLRLEELTSTMNEQSRR